MNYSELLNILPSDVKGEKFAKGTENFKIIGSLMEKQLENMEDLGPPKVQVVENIWICQSYPFRHNTTLHCADRKAKLIGNRIMQHLKF